MRICKKIAVWLGLMLLLMLPVMACAAPHVRLHIGYQDEETPLSGAHFDLYRVADMADDGKLTLTQAFSKYPISVTDLDETKLGVLAATLSSYVQRDEIAPQDSAKTNAQGKLSFSSDGSSLAPGLYLVMGRTHLQGGFEYHAQPSLLCLPYHMDGKWISEVTIRLKWEKDEEGEKPEPVRRKVLKVWADAGHENQRPQYVIVQLLGDGELYDSQVLSPANNWSYEWQDLDGSKEWTLTESGVNGYSVTVAREGITFVVINTYDEDIIVGTPTPTPQPTPTPTPTPKKTPDPTILPQTGVVWWPVPVLMAAGLIFVLLGLLIRRGERDEE